MKIHVDQVVKATITLSGAVGTQTGLSVPVAVGEQVSIEFDAGSNPNDSNWNCYVE